MYAACGELREDRCELNLELSTIYFARFALFKIFSESTALVSDERSR
jgi:hypothetical protein